MPLVEVNEVRLEVQDAGHGVVQAMPIDTIASCHAPAIRGRDIEWAFAVSSWAQGEQCTCPGDDETGRAAGRRMPGRGAA